MIYNGSQTHHTSISFSPSSKEDVSLPGTMQGLRQTPMVPRLGKISRSQASKIWLKLLPDLAMAPTIFRKRIPPARPLRPAVLKLNKKKQVRSRPEQANRRLKLSCKITMYFQEFTFAGFFAPCCTFMMHNTVPQVLETGC